MILQPNRQLIAQMRHEQQFPVPLFLRGSFVAEAGTSINFWLIFCLLAQHGLAAWCFGY